MQELVKRLIENRVFQAVVLILILINAIILGAETLPGVHAAAGQWLVLADRIIIYAFAIEVSLRVYALRASYFRSGWNVFDFLIVIVSLVAATSGLSAIRAFRVLRVLRVVTIIPRMRVVVSALLDAIPGIASVGIVVILIVYVFAVIGASLYGPAHPAIFGDVFVAMYTLFQVMTLEGWPEIAGEVSKTHPRSWIFFLTFVLIATFTMLNLFVAIVVRVVEEDSDSGLGELVGGQKDLCEEVAELRRAIADLSRKLS